MLRIKGSGCPYVSFVLPCPFLGGAAVEFCLLMWAEHLDA